MDLHLPGSPSAILESNTQGFNCSTVGLETVAQEQKADITHPQGRMGLGQGLLVIRACLLPLPPLP